MKNFANSYAVVIGIDKYRNGIPELRTAKNDAARLGDILKKRYGYKVGFLLDEDASRERILQVLNRELSQADENDRVLFYFAGHGVALDGDDGPNGYLLPQNARREDPASFIHMPLLHDSLMAVNCRHMLVILDSCFGGAFRWSSTRNFMPPPKVLHRERYERFVIDPAWQVITSASHDQTALDELNTERFGTRGERGGHSPFALALFELLENKPEELPPESRALLQVLRSDGVFTATEMYLYLEQAIQVETINAGLRQTPRLWPLKKHDKGEFVFRVPGMKLNLPPAPPLNLENNPYRGLESYNREHASLFFGRDAVIEELVQHVETRPLSVVLGASGTGKSSVVKAGLLPALHENGWAVLPTVRPGKDLSQAFVQAFGALHKKVLRSANGLAAIDALIKAWIHKYPDRKLLLVIDQFEELVTMMVDREQTAVLLAALLQWIETARGQLHVVLTLRSDFEPQFADSELKPYWQEGRYVVRPMTQDELRQVIEGPASERVLYFKPSALVDDLINEVVATPGGLPLLSFALSEMYINYLKRDSDDRALTIEDYDAVGGVVGALRTRADAEYLALNGTMKATMRRVMLRMVSEEGGELAKRRVERSELVYQTKQENDRVAEVISRLTRARLIVEGVDSSGFAYVEPAHDALVRAWDRLIGWIHDERQRLADLVFQRNLSDAANEWQRTTDKKKQKGLLWRDAVRGSMLSQLVRRKEPWMNKRENEFAHRSIRRRNAIRTGLGVLFVLIALASVIAGVQANIATVQRGIAQDSAEAAQEQRAFAILQQGIAEDSARAAQEQRLFALLQQGIAEDSARSAQEQRLIAQDSARSAQNQRGIAQDSARSAQEQRLIAQDSARSAQNQRGIAQAEARRANEQRRKTLGLALSNKSLFQLESGNVDAAALLAREAHYFNTNSNGEFHNEVYDALRRTLNALAEDAGGPTIRHDHDDWVRSVAYSDDGRWMASAGSDGKLYVSTPDPNTPVHELAVGEERSVVRQLAFGPRANWLASVDDEKRLIWWKKNPAAGPAYTSYSDVPIGDNIFRSLLFAPEGDVLALAQENNSIYIVPGPENDSRPAFQLPTPGFTVLSMAFNNDARWLIGGADDGHVRVWNMADQRVRFDSMAHPKGLRAIGLKEVNPDSVLVATGGEDFAVRLWQLDTSAGRLLPADTLLGHIGPISALAFHPNGRWLASSSGDQTVRLWQLDRLDEVAPIVLQEHDSWIESLAFSTLGDTLITGSADRKARIWRINAEALAADICSKLNGRALSLEEWARFSGGGIDNPTSCIPTNSNIAER